MYAELKPSVDLFVIRTEGRGKDTISRQLEPLGEVEELRGSDGMLLLHVNQKPSNPKAAWQRARELLGAKGIVQPVLLDESGYQQYPTGEIGIRFQTTPSTEQLKRFAASHGLRFRHRNEFVPQQAVFEPAKPGEHYLPELVQELASSKDIKSVWPNTLARFQRA